MANLNAKSVGLSLGSLLAILYTIRTIFLLLFPDFLVKYVNKIMYNMISIKEPVITADAFVIGIVVLFVAGFIFLAVFSLVYNKVVK